MAKPPSRTAGYVIGALLGVPLTLLALYFAAYVGWLGVAVAAAVTFAGGLVAWVARLAASADLRRTPAPRAR